MSNSNSYEYKIHLSIDQKSLGSDVKAILKNLQAELKDNAYKVTLTGDPKELIKQLTKLKEQIPNLDLTSGLQFDLAGVFKEQTAEGQKIIDKFTTYIINAVNDATSSVDAINAKIQETQKILNSLRSKRASLIDKDAATAFLEAEQRFAKASETFGDAKYQTAKNKSKINAAKEMKSAYQDMVNYAQEAGKPMSNTVKVFIDETTKGFDGINGKFTTLKDYLGDVKINSSFQQDLANIEIQIVENENKLRELRKELERVQNPTVNVGGKLSDTFLQDLQSQLDALTGLEVKVTPVVDKNTKLEVKADITPTTSSSQTQESAVENIKKDTEEINQKVRDSVNRFQRLQGFLSKYNQYTTQADGGNKFMTHMYSGQWSKVSHDVYSSDINNKTNLVSYKGIKKQLDEYLIIKKELDTGLSKFGDKTTYQEKDLDKQLQRLTSYVYSLHNAEKAAEVFGQKNKDIFNLVQKQIEKNIAASKAYEETQIYESLIRSSLGDYGLEQMTYNQSDQLMKVAKTGDIVEFAAKVKELFGIEIPTSVNAAKASVEGLSQTINKEEIKFYQEPSGQYSMFEMEAKSKREDAESTKILADAKQKSQSINDTPGQMTIDQFINEATSASKAADAIQTLNDVSSQQPNITGLNTIENELHDIEEAAERVLETEDVIFKGQAGDVTSGNYSYSRYGDVPNKAEYFKGNVSTTDDGTAIAERRLVNYDVLLKKLIEYDTEIYHLTEQINKAQGDTSGLEAKKRASEEQLKTYQNLLNSMLSNPDYVINNSSTQLKYIQEQRKANQDLLNIQTQINNAKDNESKKQAKISKFVKEGEVAYRKRLDYETKIAGADGNDSRIAIWQKQAQEQQNIVKLKYKELQQLGEQKKLYAQLIQMSKELVTTRNAAASHRADVNQTISDKDIQASVNKAVAAYAKLSTLQSTLAQMKQNPLIGDNDKAIQETESLIIEYQQLIATVRSYNLTQEQRDTLALAERESNQKLAKTIATLNASRQKAANAGKLEIQTLEKTRSALLKQASAFQNNGLLMKNYGDQVRAFINEIQNTSTTKERLEEIRIELNKIAAQANLAGESGKTMGQIIGTRFKSLLAYLSSFASFYRVISMVRSSLNTIKELDTQLIDLRKTTTMNNRELEEFYKNSSNIAKQLGVTTSEIISQAAAWSRFNKIDPLYGNI